MIDRKSLLVVLFLAGLSTSTAMALDPLGPATAQLKMMQGNVGIEYLFGKMNMEAGKGSVEIAGIPGSFKLPGFAIKDFETNKIYANFGFGMTNDWDVFLRVGATDAEYEDLGWMFNAGTDFAIGAGTRITWAEKENVKWGTLAQISWTQADFGDIFGEGTIDGTPFSLKMDHEADYAEIQIATGPTYELQEGCYIYGGGFFHFIDGDLEYSYVGTLGSIPVDMDESYALDEEAIFGGYIGAKFNIGRNTFLIEYQNTGQAYAFSVAFTWLFK